MTQTWDLNEAEKKTYRMAIFEDGLWDMLIGMVLLVLSFYGVMRAVWSPPAAAIVTIGVMLALGVAYWAGKNRLQASKGGKVEFTRGSKVKLGFLKLGLVILIMASAAFAVLLMTGLITRPAWMPAIVVDLLFGLVVVGVFVLMASFFGIARLYAYGLLFGLALVSTPLLAEITQWVWNPGFLLAGLIVLASGLGVYRRFLRGTRDLHSG